MIQEKKDNTRETRQERQDKREKTRETRQESQDINRGTERQSNLKEIERVKTE